jgi:hypothetical protein
MAVFVVLTLLISWLAVIPAEGGLLPHGPMIGAFIVVALVSGRQGVSDLWRQMTRWRVGWQWYLIAPGIFIAFYLVALFANLLLGARIANTVHLRSLPTVLGVIAPLVLLGGWWEEPGWTGYALRRLQGRFPHSPLLASLATGLIRMVWHTPLLLYGKIPWYDYVFYTLALQIILAWLTNRTKGSVLIAMIGHLFSNVVFATLSPLFTGADQGQYAVLFVIAATAVALGIVVATRGRLGARQENRADSSFSYPEVWPGERRRT